MLDHVGFAVRDYARSKAFYEKVLAPLGFGVVMEIGSSAGDMSVAFGPTGATADDLQTGKQSFWIGPGLVPAAPIHVAFVTRERAAVDAFHAAALAAGGHDNGPPGLRPHYHANYYAAFVLDPDGHNIEAVCHAA